MDVALCRDRRKARQGGIRKDPRGRAAGRARDRSRPYFLLRHQVLQADECGRGRSRRPAGDGGDGLVRHRRVTPCRLHHRCEPCRRPQRPRTCVGAAGAVAPAGGALERRVVARDPPAARDYAVTSPYGWGGTLMAFAAVERFIAVRYLRARREEGFISVIAGFSLIGITLGVGTLIVVMSVMNGFRVEMLGQMSIISGQLAAHATHTALAPPPHLL